MEIPPTTKVLVVGDSACGKTCTILRFANDSFSPTFISTIGIDFRNKIIFTSSGKPVRVQVWDTAGQERFRSISRSYYRGANGIILMYSVADRNSFNSIKSWINDIKMQSTKVDIVLVANKNDLTVEQRQVSDEEGQTLAKSYGLPFFEISAKTGHHVDDLFAWFAENAKTQIPIGLPNIPRKSCCY